MLWSQPKWQPYQHQVLSEWHRIVRKNACIYSEEMRNEAIALSIYYMSIQEKKLQEAMKAIATCSKWQAFAIT